ncbi:MAG TPA: nucleoside hydrolase [Candidatus Saccharimonadales bacterium]|jgi:inosine-uridine nucleoside N-ribohydrolase|nr:nucleoside hydrolase [Candidatus Saccharimonadales bacterium]
MNTKPIVIIDTDPGHDDALAIMLLIRSGRADVRAITTVAGNVDVQKTTNNARYVLDLLNSKVAIFSGSKKPLKKELIRANVHGETGLTGANITKVEPLNRLAVAKIIEIVRSNPTKVTIVTIGPETNIAKSFIKDPELPKLIKQIVIMGGAINVPGNKSAVAEFNLFVDPDAAKIVFDAPVKKIMVPLDVCNVMPLFIEDFRKIKGKLKNPILSMMRQFISGIAKFENFKGALVYDVLATYFLVNPKAYTFKKMDIRVETKGELTAGMSVADKRNWGKKISNVNVITKIDRKKFTKDFIKIMSDQ